MESTKIWKIEKNQPSELRPQDLDYEKTIHKWIENDISLIGSNLVLIGSKVITDHGKELDLLAVDDEGDLVVIELKKDKTTREVVSQVLDYVAYVNLLTEEEINKIVSKKYPDKTIQDLYNDKFGNYEEIEINENQKILVVGTSIDNITERVIKYLSSRLVNINATTFSYFRDGRDEYITRNVLLVIRHRN